MAEENRVLSLRAFKRRFRLSQKQVNRMVERGTIQIQQNGYLGHSLAHHKLVLYPKKFRRPEFVVEERKEKVKQLKKKLVEVRTEIRRTSGVWYSPTRLIQRAERLRSQIYDLEERII